ncbi:MAG: DUF721 domain-containing protein [Bacteroidaceae bacterium]|nr:DUF721 domain-containing protein [Bacteroidaceae bacterium]
MERRKTENLRDVINRYLRLNGLETPLNEQRAIEAWPDVVGPTIARQSSDLQIRGGVLYVKIARPALRQDLMMMRTELAHRINQHIKAQVIESISFH